MVPFSYQHLLATVRVPVTRSERLWKTLWPPATPGQYTLRMERGGGFQGSISLQIGQKFRQILKILPEELNSTLARSHWIISKIHTFSHTFRTRDSQTAPEVVSMVPSSYQHLLATVRVPVARPERLWKPIRPPATPGQYTFRMERGGGFQGGQFRSRSPKNSVRILSILPEELNSTLARNHLIFVKFSLSVTQFERETLRSLRRSFRWVLSATNTY